MDVNTIELSKRNFTRMTAAYQIYDKISSETLGKPKLIQRLILKSITQKKRDVIANLSYNCHAKIKTNRCGQIGSHLALNGTN